MAKVARVPVPQSMEYKVLDTCRRKCALCYYLTSDLSEKRGQIAHLDKDPSNNNEDNLAFLCMDHHSVFDSKTSQHKNYTVEEVKGARIALYRAIEDGDHLAGASPRALRISGTETDRKTLVSILNSMEETGSISLLRSHSFFYPFNTDKLVGLERMTDAIGAEDEFIDNEIENLRKSLVKHCVEFMAYVGSDTFRVDGGLQGLPTEWKKEDISRYRRVAEGLNVRAQNAVEAFDLMVRQARKKLAP